MRPLTETQARVLDQLRGLCCRNVVRYRYSRHYHLHLDDVARLERGDQAAVFGLGGLTFQVGHQLGMAPAKVLRTFKALKAKVLVISEEKGCYQRALYWWPVGLAAEIEAQIGRAMA